MLKPVSAGVIDLQPFRDVLVVNPERIGHADGQALGATERCHDLFHFGADGHEHIDHALSDVIRIKAAKEFWILAGDTLGAQTDVTDVAAAHFIAQAACGRLHDVLADMDTRGTEHDQGHAVLAEGLGTR